MWKDSKKSGEQHKLQWRRQRSSIAADSVAAAVRPILGWRRWRNSAAPGSIAYHMVWFVLGWSTPSINTTQILLIAYHHTFKHYLKPHCVCFLPAYVIFSLWIIFIYDIARQYQINLKVSPVKRSLKLRHISTLVSTRMSDHQQRPGAVKQGPFVGVDLISVTNRLYIFSFISQTNKQVNWNTE